MKMAAVDIHEKISKAEEEKEAGNVFFKAGNIKQAIKKYHFSLLYLKDIENPSPVDKLIGSEGKKVSDEDVFLIQNLRAICYNNLSACLMKTKCYSKVIEYSTKTLDVDPNNIKALFRRGQAHINLKDVDRAEYDFLMIKSLDDKEKCMEKYFPLIEAERKRQMSKEKELYKKMMECNGNH